MGAHGRGNMLPVEMQLAHCVLVVFGRTGCERKKREARTHWSTQNRTVKLILGGISADIKVVIFLVLGWFGALFDRHAVVRMLHFVVGSRKSSLSH